MPDLHRGWRPGFRPSQLHDRSMRQPFGRHFFMETVLLLRDISVHPKC
jgi:hypothetical protein